MTTTLEQLVVNTRRFLQAYQPPASALTISLSSTATSITVADTSVFTANWTAEIDYETLLLGPSLSTTATTVIRGWAGTTAVSHTNTSTILVRPAFSAAQIIDALNEAKDEMYPYVYKPVLDTSLTADSVTYEFTIPSTIKSLSKVDMLVTGDTSYRLVRDWTVVRSATPKLKFKRAPQGGTLRLHGYGTFDDLALSGDTVDSLFPTNAIRILPLGAASLLQSSGEAGRSRFDVGLQDARESAQRAGASSALADKLERRFEKALARSSQPPLPKHVISVL